jgi:signal transduction histidine kinase
MLSKNNKTSSDSDYCHCLESEIEDLKKEIQKLYNEKEASAHELKKYQKLLIQSEKMASLGNLMAGIAHDVNTPMGIGVTAASHLEYITREITKQYEAQTIELSDLENYFDQAAQSSELILANLKNSANLIKSVKVVATDQTSSVKRVFNFSKYIDDIFLSLKPRLKNRKIDVQVCCPQDIVLNSYPGPLAQIITNLVINSLNHAFVEQDTGVISLDVKELDSEILFCFRDNGSGMEKEIQDRIFTAFFTTKQGQGGTGLGLSVVHDIITNTIGGSIKCISEQGQGTIFEIRIPLET